MSGNGIPGRVMGDGEGHTTLVLTDAESRLVRNYLTTQEARLELEAFNRGVHRATARIKAEFDTEARRRKDTKK